LPAVPKQADNGFYSS